MTRVRKHFLLSMALIAVGMVYSSTAQGDPLFFSNVVALQNNGSTSVDLFSNPGVTLYGPQITFTVDITGTLPPGGVDKLLVTYVEAGSPPIFYNFDIPFGGFGPPFSILFTIVSPGANFQGIAGSLTLDLMNSSGDFVIPGGQSVNSYTYNFKVAQPVPEPASLTFAAISVAGLVARLRRRRKADRTT